MTFDEIYKKYRDGFVGLIDCPDMAKELTEVQGDMQRRGDCVWYKCPCGGDDHYSCRNYYPDGLSKTLSPVILCLFTMKQWMVRIDDPMEIIFEEENKYLENMAKWTDLVRKVIKKRGYSEETKGFLRDTHGVPVEETESIMESSNE